MNFFDSLLSIVLSSVSLFICKFSNLHIFLRLNGAISTKLGVDVPGVMWYLLIPRFDFQYNAEMTRVDPDHLLGLVTEVVPDHSCLIFCSTKKNCENVALMLSKLMAKHRRLVETLVNILPRPDICVCIIVLVWF